MMKSANCISAIGRKPVHCRTNSDTCNCRFCKWCINNTVFPKLIVKTLCCFKNATFYTNIFSKNENTIISFHFFFHSQCDRINIRHDSHYSFPPSSAYT